MIAAVEVKFCGSDNIMVAENHFPIGQQSASKTSNGGIDVLANPALNIPSEQTLMELEATLKGLVANSAIASTSFH